MYGLTLTICCKRISSPGRPSIWSSSFLAVFHVLHRAACATMANAEVAARPAPDLEREVTCFVRFALSHHSPPRLTLPSDLSNEFSVCPSLLLLTW
jgi:hypothetical protein